MNRSLLLALAALAAALHAEDNPYGADARQSYALVKDSLLKAADRMPTEDYSFRTTPKVRTFAEMIAHVATAQMLMCGVVKGEKSIADPQFKPAKTAKADLVTDLKASFDYCDPVYESMTDAGGRRQGQMVHWRHEQAWLIELEHFARQRNVRYYWRISAD